MKTYKSSLLITLLMIAVMPTFAQTVHIEYSEKINTDVPTHLSLKQDNKTYLKIDVEADLSSKKTAIFNFYTATDGVVSKFDMGIPVQMSGFWMILMISDKRKKAIHRLELDVNPKKYFNKNQNYI